MTEQQHIAAIDALAEELLFKAESRTWEQAGSEMKEHFRRQAMKELEQERQQRHDRTRENIGN